MQLQIYLGFFFFFFFGKTLETEFIGAQVLLDHRCVLETTAGPRANVCKSVRVHVRARLYLLASA